MAFFYKKNSSFSAAILGISKNFENKQLFSYKNNYSLFL